MTPCLHEADFRQLIADVEQLKVGQKTMLASQTVIEHVLIGNLSEADRRGLLEEHHEHRKTLFGDKKIAGDHGLVGDMRQVRTTLEQGKWFSKGVSAAFGLLGAGIAFIGFKGLAALAGWVVSARGNGQ